jgi:hypothetical protein
MNTPDNLFKAVMGKDIGTIVKSDIQ